MKKYLIAGLGNIGAEYANTRHNIGFKVLDSLARESSISFSSERYADKAELKVKGRSIILIKPNTYMNLSGKAINYWLQFEKIPLQNLLVLVDDIALDFGSLRLKTKGSDGGHNGLKNIQQILGRQDYARLRIGISGDFSKGQQIDYVLGEWNAAEEKEMPELIQRSSDAAVSFALQGAANTMNQFNG